MNHALELILPVAVAVAIALAGGVIAHALRQSVIVGYLLAGVAVGPFALGFLTEDGQIAALAEVGVIFLMFALGIEFSLKELGSLRGVALLGTGAQMLLTIAAGVGLGLALGWPVSRGLFFGGVIAISSTMVILKTLIDRGDVASRHGRVLLAMLITQDLAVVFMIALLPKLFVGAGAPVGEVALTALTAIGFIAATLFLGARVVPRLMAAVETWGSHELFLLTAVTLALGTAALSAWLGLSPALGAFMAGLMLAETEFDHRVVAEVVPMRNLFATLFFVSVGLLIDPGFILANLPAVLGLTLFIVIAKALLTLVALLPFQLGARTTLLAALAMIQLGEFSYVLAAAGLAAGAIDRYLHDLILTASLLTIVLTPAAFWLGPRLEGALVRLPLLGRLLDARFVISDRVASLSDHAIVIGYGRVGRHVTQGLRQAGVPALVIESDLHQAREISRQGTLALFGDAAYPGIIEAAGIERAAMVVVALPDMSATRAVVRNARQAHPTIPILARVAREEQEERVRQAGATAVVAPESAGAAMLLLESARAVDRLAPADVLPSALAADAPGVAST